MIEEVSWGQSVKGLSLHILINNAGQVTVPFGRSNQPCLAKNACIMYSLEQTITDCEFL